jgi:phosphoesterase RecJ-like protein
MIDPAKHAVFGRAVERGKRFALTTHVNPDGDAIGSEMGLARYLRSLGKELRIVNQDRTPENLRFLEGDGLAVEIFDAAVHEKVLADADYVVLLDNSAPDRLGRMEGPMRANAAHVLCIDHHPTRGTPWEHNILDDEASATAALVYLLTRGQGYRLDARAAEALYVGLATDTGFFRFNSTRPEAHEVAAELIRAGADPAKCFQEVYERNSAAYTLLLGKALSALRLSEDGAVASCRLTRAAIEGCGATAVDTSEMTTPLLAIGGVRIAMLFRELDGGRVKVSLRSKGELDVHGLAAEFGGGGHRNASGIVMSGALDEVADTVVAKAEALVRGQLPERPQLLRTLR